MLGKGLPMIIGIHFVPYQGQQCYFCGFHGKFDINIVFYNTKRKILTISSFYAIQRPLLSCYTTATSPDVKVWLNIILGDNLCMTNWNGTGHAERNFSLSIIKVFIYFYCLNGIIHY